MPGRRILAKGKRPQNTVEALSLSSDEFDQRVTYLAQGCSEGSVELRLLWGQAHSSARDPPLCDVPLAMRQGLTEAAWNIESACASSIVALQTAAAPVRAGEYRNMLVVVSAAYSRTLDDCDTMAWFLAAGAVVMRWVVEPANGTLPMVVANVEETHSAKDLAESCRRRHVEEWREHVGTR